VPGGRRGNQRRESCGRERDTRFSSEAGEKACSNFGINRFLGEGKGDSQQAARRKGGKILGKKTVGHNRKHK